MAKLKKAQVVKILRELYGNVALTAQKFGVDRSTIYRFIHRHNLEDVLDETRETKLDIAESSLMRGVINGEAWAVCFTLKTIGKKRGYVERIEQEVTGKNGGAVEVRTFTYGSGIASLKPSSQATLGDEGARAQSGSEEASGS